MNINTIHPSSSMIIHQQLNNNLQKQNVHQALDNDGDHDHGIPDGDKGRHIDIRA